ncbi:MAG: hypothetical protein AB1772_13030 [Candidatus Zixiibacteriota bacterium]
MSDGTNEGRKFLGVTGKGWGKIAAIVAILSAIIYLFKRKKNPHVR